MLLQGSLHAESPIYRGNARKTLFTRDGDGTQRLVSLAGEIEGTAQALMDAFVGTSRNGRNIGLLNELWLRLYQEQLPRNLISSVTCRLKQDFYPRDKFFDLRMGIKLDEDRWAAEANANYKMETLFRNSVFEFEMRVNDTVLSQGDNKARLFFVLEELRAGRFWFGAGKTKGMGRCRLEMELPFSAESLPKVNPKANHLNISFRFNTQNPILVGWNWGKVDPHTPAFAAVDGRVLIGTMRNIPDAIRQRLEMALGGPILNPKDWKQKFNDMLPRVLAIWLQEAASQAAEAWVLPKSALAKLGKGKHALSKKIMQNLEPLAEQAFTLKDEAENAIKQALGKKLNMARRVTEVLEHKMQSIQKFNREAWNEAAARLGLEPNLGETLVEKLTNESELVKVLQEAITTVLPELNRQVDQQIRLLQSDPWINQEIATREAHIKIKKMVLSGEISEQQWGNPAAAPEGVKPADWQEFLAAHQRVSYRYMNNRRNLEKSIVNDQNFIDFLKAHRTKIRQELGQPQHIDYRAGGVRNREISKKHGKPYDTIFMRMLTWAPSSSDREKWEVYIPGSTIKGAFRKRASQILKTYLGETPRAEQLLTRLFGTQGQRGMVLFSDAYLKNPDVSAENWCSMDGVKMDPYTAEPIEEAKADYLFAYGSDLQFEFRIDAMDLDKKDIDAFSLLAYLVRDFQNGDIPIGGEKTKGFGWAKGEIEAVNWLFSAGNPLGKEFFSEKAAGTEGMWQAYHWPGSEAQQVFQIARPLFDKSGAVAATPPKARQGFISHRSFGGYCGTLEVQGEVLTALSIQESGQPSHSITMDNEPVNGWDFYSIAPPDADKRGSNRVYALPSKSIRGALRHIYSIASDSKSASEDIGRLNPADSLFGWVGTGPNQALTSRLSIDFGIFEAPELAWFKVPYPYGAWKFIEGKWQKAEKGRVVAHRIDDTWRVFPHTPLAPIVEQATEFKPDTAQASYMRAILPGSKCRFTVRFWNLEEEELQRLIWCIGLENNLAYKMGKGRYLGLGSIRFTLLPESHLIDWGKRYGDGDDWKKALDPAKWQNESVIHHVQDLRKYLDADAI